MPFPIAHALMGASMVAIIRHDGSFKREWKYLSLGAFLGVLPDFDYALSWARVGGRGWHHDFTHSILFAFLVGLVTAVVINHFTIRNVTAFFLAMLSHPVMDFLFTESRGIKLLWPVSAKLFKVGLQSPISYNWRLSPLAAKIEDIFELCLMEFAVFATILLVILWVKGRINRKIRMNRMNRIEWVQRDQKSL